MRRRVGIRETRTDLAVALKDFGIPGAVELERRDAGLCLVETRRGGVRDLTSYRLTAREMSAALEVAIVLLDVARQAGQIPPPGSVVLTPEQAARYRRAVSPCAFCGGTMHPEAMYYDPEEENTYCDLCSGRVAATLQPPINPHA